MINLKNQRLLVIAPHPDDEVIGCAGLIQKVKEQKGKVFVLFLTVADTKDFSPKGYSSLEIRKNEIDKVSKLLKFDKYDIALEGKDFHLKLDIFGQERLMNLIERESSLSLEKINPTMVVFPSFTSYNQDHRVTALAVHAALRPSEKNTKHFVPCVLSFEEPADSWNTSSQNTPTIFIPLTRKDISIKLEAMKLYRSQMRAFPNMRSIKTLETLAVLRGSMIGQAYAEAYTNYRLMI